MSWYSGDYETKKFTFESNDHVTTAVVTLLVVFVQMFGPVVIFCVVLCVVLWKAMNLDKVDDVEVENLRRIHQNDLGEFQRIHPGPTENYDQETMLEFQRLVADFQTKLSEIQEKKDDRTKEATSRVKLFRTYSLYYYVTFWIWLIYLVLYVTTKLFGGSVFGALYLASIVFVIACYLLVLLEFRFSAEREYILNLSSTVFAAERIDSIRASQPSVIMQAVCYHYETRTRTVTYTDASGNLQTSLETYQEKVITGTYTDTFDYSYWKDTSKMEVAGISQRGITKIKMTLNVDTGDEETALALTRQYTDFRLRYQNYDTHVDYSKVNHVPGFQKRLAAYTDSKYKPWWINWYVYLAATVLLVGWPYRWIFNAVTHRTRYTVSKVIYVGRPEGEEGRQRDDDDDNIGVSVFIRASSQNGDVEMEERPPPYSSLPPLVA